MRPLLATGAVVALAVWSRRTLRSWGATPEEQRARMPGDDVVADATDHGTMATTIDAPPEAIWPWLAQMGCDRAGFYSWDLLDNGGRPSAKEIHDAWQDLEVGSRIMSRPGGKAWFDVVVCDPPHALVLRATLAGNGESFDPDGRWPTTASDSTWAFHLRPLPGGRTRLLVRSRGRTTSPIIDLAGIGFWEPAHWVMQTKQFREIARRVAYATQ